MADEKDESEAIIHAIRKTKVQEGKGQPVDPYAIALDAAMQQVGEAIGAKLGSEKDHWRFHEVQRLARIGEAIGRQKARSSQRVDDYVDPNRRRGCRPHVRYANQNQEGGVGGVDPLMDDDLFPGGNINDWGDNVRIGAHQYAGAPHREPQPSPLPIRTDSDERFDRLNEIKLLNELISSPNCTDSDKKILQERKDAVLAETQEATARTKGSARARDRFKAKLDRLNNVVRCPECGNAHDDDWVDDGVPRNCDVCGNAMELHAVNDEVDDRQQNEPQENEQR